MSERDLADKTFVVTGSNTGIGRVTAHELAKRGAHVVMACRSEDKTKPVLDEIAKSTDNDRIEFLRLDLGDLAQVRESAAELLERGHPIDVLINNAGVAGQRGVTKDGFELAFGVNHLGHFAFTNLLLDRIKESSKARIVTVSSKSHYRAKAIDWTKVRGKTRTTTGMAEYETSKLCNVLFSAELGRRLEGTGVSTYSLHPGVVASDIWRRVPWPFRSIMKMFMISNEEGAQTTLYCATSAEAADDSGYYYDQCKRRAPSHVSQDTDLAEELWTRSEEWCAA